MSHEDEKPANWFVGQQDDGITKTPGRHYCRSFYGQRFEETNGVPPGCTDVCPETGVCGMCGTDTSESANYTTFRIDADWTWAICTVCGSADVTDRAWTLGKDGAIRVGWCAKPACQVDRAASTWVTPAVTHV